MRLNSNPFSPEYDKLGLGRIEIFTKPGTDKYHGTVTYNLGTDWWNSRNPFATQKAPFLLEETENSASGPITKRSSFTFDLERQAVDNGSVTNGVVLAPATFAATPFTSVFRTPQRHTKIGPHIDYQINDNNYLLAAVHDDAVAHIEGAGIGNFNLISRGYRLQNTFNTFQAIETSVHGSSVNETRFQYFRWGSSSTADTAGPQIMVLGAFNGGAASAVHDHYVQSFYEFQNNTSIVHGAHVWRFGMRLQTQQLERQLFAGEFQRYVHVQRCAGAGTGCEQSGCSGAARADRIDRAIPAHSAGPSGLEALQAVHHLCRQSRNGREPVRWRLLRGRRLASAAESSP